MSRLSWAPIDSTEARELRELEAERATEQQAQPQHDDRCRGGWLGEDAEGRPVACPACRPHLQNLPCRTCQVKANTCEEGRRRLRGPCCEQCEHRTMRARLGDSQASGVVR